MSSAARAPEWVRSYETQAGEVLRPGVFRGPQRRAAVADALADIWIGRIAWDPNVQSLEWAVRDVLRHRIPRSMARARMHVCIDDLDPDDDDEQRHFEPSHVNALLTEDAAVVAEQKDFVRHMLAALRRIVQDDVLPILDLFEAGVTSRVDIMEALGISEREYRRRWMRLARCADKLPPDLRPDGRGRRVRERVEVRGAPTRAESPRPFDLATALGLLDAAA